jgi:hypothetical protein
MKVIPKDASYYLADYLHHEEFKCKCTHERCFVTIINPKCIMAFSTLRSILGRPIVLTSGFRCPPWNQFVGGVERSTHQSGSAMDFLYPSNYDKEEFIKDCQATFDVVLPYENYIHCNVRG